jgi:hypothetical protein
MAATELNQEMSEKNPELKDTTASLTQSTGDVAFGEMHEEIDPVWAKKVIRKIDKRILLCCLITYTMNFVDKTLLGQSAIFGIIQSNVRSFTRDLRSIQAYE